MGEPDWIDKLTEVFLVVYSSFQNMTTYLLNNKLFLIGLTIFVIGACIALVKRVIK